MSLELVPTLRLRGNRILRRGPDGVDKVDPARIAEWAAEMADAGARWVHVEDLDAREGRPSQWTCVPALQSQGLRIQFGGGVKRMVQVQQLLDLGVDRVVLGRQAQAEPKWAEEVVKLYPGKLILCLGGQGEKTDILVQRAASAKSWHVGGLLAPAAAHGAKDVDLLTRLHTAAPSPKLYGATGLATTNHVAALEDAGAKGLLLHDVASGDLQALIEAFPQRVEAPPIQVLHARGAAALEDLEDLTDSDNEDDPGRGDDEDA